MILEYPHKLYEIYQGQSLEHSHRSESHRVWFGICHNPDKCDSKYRLAEKKGFAQFMINLFSNVTFWCYENPTCHLCVTVLCTWVVFFCVSVGENKGLTSRTFTWWGEQGLAHVEVGCSLWPELTLYRIVLSISSFNFPSGPTVIKNNFQL